MKKLLLLVTLMSSAIALASPASANAVNAVSIANTTKSDSTVESTEINSGCFFTDSHSNIWEFVKIPSGNIDSNTGITAYKYSGETPSYVHEYGFMNSQGISNITYDDIINCKRIILEKNKSSEVVKKYDMYPDGCIDIIDATLMYQYYISTPYNFVSDGTKSMDSNTFWKIFEQKASTGENKITIVYGDVPASTTVSSTSTTASSSTSVRTTSTTAATSTSVRTTSTTASSSTSVRTTSTTAATSTSVRTTSTTASSSTSVRTTSTTASTSTSVRTTSTTAGTSTSTNTTSTITYYECEFDGEYYWNPDDGALGPDSDAKVYKILMETIELYGFEHFKIVWSKDFIPYAWVIPSSWTAYNSTCTYCFQLIPSYHIEEICKREWLKYPYHIWRPSWVDGTTKCPNCTISHYQIDTREGTEWLFASYYQIIPTDENGNDILTLGSNIPKLVESFTS